jgi:hypothetical protein
MSVYFIKRKEEEFRLQRPQPLSHSQTERFGMGEERGKTNIRDYSQNKMVTDD